MQSNFKSISSILLQYYCCCCWCCSCSCSCCCWWRSKSGFCTYNDLPTHKKCKKWQDAGNCASRALKYAKDAGDEAMRRKKRMRKGIEIRRRRRQRMQRMLRCQSKRCCCRLLAGPSPQRRKFLNNGNGNNSIQIKKGVGVREDQGGEGKGGCKDSGVTSIIVKCSEAFYQLHCSLAPRPATQPLPLTLKLCCLSSLSSRNLPPPSAPFLFFTKSKLFFPLLLLAAVCHFICTRCFGIFIF